MSGESAADSESAYLRACDAGLDSFACTAEPEGGSYARCNHGISDRGFRTGCARRKCHSPPGTPHVTMAADTKQLIFDWDDAIGATYYRLW